MKIRVIILIGCMLLLLGSGVYALNHSEPTPKDNSHIINEEQSPIESDCEDSKRIACVPKGGGYNIENGDVTDRYGQVVSTRSERR